VGLGLFGWAAVLDQIVKLDFDVVAPGSGPVMSRAAFELKTANLSAALLSCRL
jgi:hypothetical protein